MNLYAYVGNDPVNRVDPWGLFEYCWTERSGAATEQGEVITSTSEFRERCLRLLDDRGIIIEVPIPGEAQIDAALGLEGRPLTRCERDAMRGHFPEGVLARTRVYSGFPTPMLPSKPNQNWGGITLPREGGGRIFFGYGEYNPGTTRGLGFLAHELDHATRYANGTMTVASYLAGYRPAGYDYHNNRYEREARQTEANVIAALGTRTCPQP